MLVTSPGYILGLASFQGLQDWQSQTQTPQIQQ